MEQLTEFVTKTFEKKEIGPSDKDLTEEIINNEENLPSKMDTSQRHTSSKSPERASPKTDAEKKENLQNVVDVLANSQKRIMENLYQKLEVKKTIVAINSSPSEELKNFCGDDKSVRLSSVRPKAMDIANLIGDHNKTKSLEENVSIQTKSETQLNIERETKAPEMYPTEFSSPGSKPHSRGSSVSPIIDPEDSRSSIGSESKRDLHDNRSKIYLENEDDLKTSKFNSNN